MLEGLLLRRSAHSRRAQAVQGMFSASFGDRQHGTSLMREAMQRCR